MIKIFRYWERMLLMKYALFQALHQCSLGCVACTDRCCPGGLLSAGLAASGCPHPYRRCPRGKSTQLLRRRRCPRYPPPPLLRPCLHPPLRPQYTLTTTNSIGHWTNGSNS